MFEVFRRLNEATGVTVVIVTHDAAIIANVDRVVTMHDGRASAEIVRRTRFTREHELDVDEFALVDRSGRVQIPREFAEQLGLGARARLSFEGDHVEVRAGGIADEATDEVAAPGPSAPDDEGPETAVPEDAAPPDAPRDATPEAPPSDWSRPAGPGEER